MKCIYCNNELLDEGIYGRLALHQDGKIIGRVYKCPNSEGFTNINEAQQYAYSTGIENYDIDELVCHSAIHNGSFYTFNDELQTGYPC